MSRCSMCPNVNTCVEAQGPENAEIMLIGEAPGKDENRIGQPFVGKTGTELDSHFLPLAGLRRNEVYVTNTIMCLPTTSGGKLQMSEEKDKALARACAQHHLFEEIERVKPHTIVPMGAFANYVLDDTISLDLHHGIPRDFFDFTLGNVESTLFPMWHPAGGIHEPKKMLQIRTDWIRLKRYLYGSLPVWSDPFPNPDYQKVSSVSEIRSLGHMALMGCDTEFDPDGNPVCLTYSVRPGSGRLIYADRRDLLSAFQQKLDEWQGLIIFHHWMADKPMVEKMGLRFPQKLIRDSMIRISLLGNLPKGLKAFAFRELGMAMTDFEDVVFPYSIPRILDYYLAIQKLDWPKPEAEMVRDSKTMLWKLYRAHGMNTKIKRFFTDIRKNPNKDIVQTWDNWKQHHEEIEAVVGKFNKLDVRDLPEEELIRYANRDADATLRAWPVLERIVDNMFGKAQENWRVD